MTRWMPAAINFLTLLAIAALCFMAVSHPVYDLLVREDHATFFVVHESKAVDIYLLVFTLSVALPLALCALVIVASLVSRTFGRVVYSLVVFMLFTIFYSFVSARLPGNLGWASSAIAVAAALASTILFATRLWMRQFLSVVAIGAIISPVLFLTNPVIREFLSTPAAQDYEIDLLGRAYPNVVMIVFDEFPLISLLDDNRQIDEVRFPNFARLADTSNWYRNTVTPHTTTSKAIPAILTGRYINQNNSVVGPSAFPHSLVRHLQSTHNLRGVEVVSTFFDSPENDRIAPILRVRIKRLGSDVIVLLGHMILPQPLVHNLPSIRAQWAEFHKQAPKPQALQMDRPKKVRDFMNMLRTTPHDVPALYYLHVLLPHSPLRYNDDGRNYVNELHGYGLGTRSATANTFARNRQDALLIHQAHLLQTRFVDLLLGEILDELDSLGLFEDSLIVVTSDHGIGYLWYEDGEVDQQQLFSLRAAEVYWVPLFIKQPGQSHGQTIDRKVLTIDIFPSVADVLGKPIPWEVDGFSVFVPPAEIETRKGTGNPKRGESWLRDERPNPRPLQTRIELFGQHNLKELYHFGPFKGLVGQNIEMLAVESGVPGTPRYRLETHNEIGTDNNRVPLYLKGELTFATAEHEPEPLPWLAININGTIWGTASPVVREDQIKFTTRIPVEAWNSEANQISIYAIRENSGGEFLHLEQLEQAD